MCRAWLLIEKKVKGQAYRRAVRHRAVLLNENGKWTWTVQKWTVQK